MSELKSWILIILVAFLLSFLVRIYVVQPYRVEMTSMLDTLFPNDLVLVDKITYRFQSPKRGDVVVFIPPNNVREKYIKRVIGLPGDTIEIKDGTTYINGKPMVEPYVYSPMRYDYGPVEVPESHIFVMGDNRSVSLDSRSFGPVERSSIIGKAVFVYFPFSHIENLNAYSGTNP